MIRLAVDHHVFELIFRLLFSSIFIVLGGEHIFNDDLIQRLMPEWLPMKRLISLGSGLLLLGGGTCIALGFEMKRAAAVLAVFLVVVTAVIHIPGMMFSPSSLSEDWRWLWDIYQRSNFIKNVCLLGVCFHFFYHEPGRYSLESWMSASG